MFTSWKTDPGLEHTKNLTRSTQKAQPPGQSNSERAHTLQPIREGGGDGGQSVTGAGAGIFYWEAQLVLTEPVPYSRPSRSESGIKPPSTAGPVLIQNSPVPHFPKGSASTGERFIDVVKIIDVGQLLKPFSFGVDQ